MSIEQLQTFPTTDSPKPRLTDSRLASLVAKAIHEALEEYQLRFALITRRSRARFETCDWHGMRADARERLSLYKAIIDQIEAGICDMLGDRLKNSLVWISIKAVYSSLIAYHDDWEIAETFFNSITRRIFATVGVNPKMEFVDTDFETPPTESRGVIYQRYVPDDTTAELLQEILTQYYAPQQFAHLEEHCRLAATKIDLILASIGPIDSVEMIGSVFYRGKGAYLIGRIAAGSTRLPITLALTNSEAGISIDSVLVDENSISIIFSFAHSYFHVEVERPYDMVQFLKSIMPRKRVAELYISLGFNKHGKTELYRDILHHLEHSEEQFEISPGQRGMVMTVFNMPDYDLVFKLIKDRFAYPKTATRQDVMDKYDFVFKQDRAGRLIDAQVFEHLKFKRTRFSEELLEELQRVAADTVRVENIYVVIHHAYVERRVTPLDLYIRKSSEEEAAAAVIDYGQAIKDLASSNIFPGDMLLKNFGVTRHGRVVFYDYDELRMLTACNFRQIPQARSYEDELASEPWYHVSKNDIFPEEFERFLGLSPSLLNTFKAQHADLLHHEFWQKTQARIKDGELINIFPYSESKRLRSAGTSAEN